MFGSAFSRLKSRLSRDFLGGGGGLEKKFTAVDWRPAKLAV